MRTKREEKVYKAAESVLSGVFKTYGFLKRGASKTTLVTRKATGTTLSKLGKVITPEEKKG